MKRAVLLSVLLAGVACLAQIPAAGQQAPPAQAGRGGRGGFGGPIELGPDDKQVFPEPPAGFDVRRDNIPHGEIAVVQYDSKSLGTHRQMRVYTPPVNEPPSAASALAARLRSSWRRYGIPAAP